MFICLFVIVQDSGEGNVEKLAPATSGNIAGSAGLAKGKVGAPLGKDDKLLNGGPVVQGGAAGALAMGLKVGLCDFLCC